MSTAEDIIRELPVVEDLQVETHRVDGQEVTVLHLDFQGVAWHFRLTDEHLELLQTRTTEILSGLRESRKMDSLEDQLAGVDRAVAAQRKHFPDYSGSQR